MYSTDKTDLRVEKDGTVIRPVSPKGVRWLVLLASNTPISVVDGVMVGEVESIREFAEGAEGAGMNVER